MSQPGPVVVLMYHGLEKPGNPSGYTEKGELIYVLAERDLIEHAAAIAESPATVILPGEDQPGGLSLMLTFDDGHLSNYSMALPVLKQAGLRAAFFITTGYIGTDNYMTEDMVREVAEAGMAIGSHAKTHRFLTDLSDEEVRIELESSREVLGRITGKKIDLFSAPGGRIDRRVERIARETGYRWIFGSEAVVNDSLAEGAVAGRFAVMRNTSPEWFERVISGRPPAGAMVRHKVLGALKKILGTRLYLKLRKSLLGEE